MRIMNKSYKYHMMWLFAVSTSFCYTCLTDIRYFNPPDSLSTLYYIYISSIPIYLTFLTILAHLLVEWKLIWNCTCSYLPILFSLLHIYSWSTCLLTTIWLTNFENLSIICSQGMWNRTVSLHLIRILCYFPSGYKEFWYFQVGFCCNSIEYFG